MTPTARFSVPLPGSARLWQQRQALNKAQAARPETKNTGEDDRHGSEVAASMGTGGAGACHQRRAVGADARHGEAPVSMVPLLLRRASTQPRATLSGLHEGEQSPAADQRPTCALATPQHDAPHRDDTPSMPVSSSALPGMHSCIARHRFVFGFGRHHEALTTALRLQERRIQPIIDRTDFALNRKGSPLCP